MILRTTLALVLLAAVAEARKPNVVIIYTDDQGSVDVNCYGATDLVTPHMDGLAKRGVRFTQFYSAAPVCSPSRAAMITGRVPQRAGVPGNVSSQKGGKGMPPEQVTIAEMLKANGYATGHVGKWHLGYTPETMPRGQGFDHSFGHMGGCIDNWSHFFYWNGPNRHDLWRNGEEIWRDGEFFPEMMVEEADAFIAKHEDEPFFLYWAINVPHYPLQGTDAWRKRYADLDPPRRMYAAFVSTMDEMIGRVLKSLDDRGLTDDTIVIFQSDHGHSCEQRTFGGGGSAGPYRGAKFSLFEGGIRVPAIVSWPGELPEGEVRGQAVWACDWLPTIAALTESDLPERRLDGRDITTVIRDTKAESPHEVFHWQSGGGWAVRKGDWKLLGNPRDTANVAPLGPNDKRFLVDLSNDVGERTNLAAKHPTVVRDLEALHREWARTSSDQ